MFGVFKCIILGSFQKKMHKFYKLNSIGAFLK